MSKSIIAGTLPVSVPKFDARHYLGTNGQAKDGKASKEPGEALDHYLPMVLTKIAIRWFAARRPLYRVRLNVSWFPNPDIVFWLDGLLTKAAIRRGLS